MTIKTFAVLGTTDDVTECELCGRAELKGTVVLDALDAEGNRTGDVSYYGVSCAAKAAKWTQAEVRRAARDADAAERRRAEEARRAECDRQAAEFRAGFHAWLKSEFGVIVSVGDDVWAALKATPYRTPFRAQQAYSDSLARH